MAAFDFRAQQERARHLSVVLVLAFIVMVAIISLLLGALIAAFLGGDPTAREIRLEPAPAIAIALGIMAVIVGVALFKIVSFGGDGARVATSLGAEEVTEDTQNPFKKRYLNVVEEMAIAAGLPRPRAFVVKHEQGINAFAAGGSPEKAAISVTHGALAKLNRQELTGVVAHEMAHIANHDTRLNMRLMGMVFGLVILYTSGHALLRSSIFMRRGRGNRGTVPILAIGLGLIVLGLLGVLGGRILQSAVSRRREYLADATGVQFTRNPTGLANALKKIGATTAGSHVDNSHAEEARHMFFAQATGSFAGLFSTHPPLHDRVRALDPQFNPATDPIYTKGDKRILRETRHELFGPWG
ncbi:M48 family metallopeptidase [Chelativorans salis]|uniref:M48 family metallopeptidase n=1 Tax=Chelativorans salis TaxID=2978478 RepID=A0ABT2LI27_9HYPH|nr:M48 family metallopeptidase [Chelativorans sp. EGI FJ00035]MCT7374225.1 M48 family metallopeptidase [Chelativorans sp. EGI FJ00035]